MGKHAPKGLVANPSRRNPLKMADSRRERKLKEIAEEAERAISSLQNKLKGDKKVRKCHVTDITYNSSGERIVKAPRRPSRSSSSVQSTSTRVSIQNPASDNVDESLLADHDDSNICDVPSKHIEDNENLLSEAFRMAEDIVRQDVKLKRITWQTRQKRLEKNWEGSRETSFSDALSKEALPPSVKCSMCNSDLQQCVRCMDCGPCFFVCSKCDMNIHNSHPMHDQEFGNGEFFQSLLPTEAIDSQGKLFPLRDQLKSRVKKICEGFRATLYPCPDTAAERREMAIGVTTRIEDLQTVLNETRDHRHRLLMTVEKNINQWFIKVKKIKAIYHTMNMFNLDVTQKCLIAECWCPVSDLDRIQQALRRGTERSGAAIPSILNRMTTRQEPPTFNRTNKFTQGFQAIVDAYGVANYQEVNPALFTVITFPFLFAVMFGDCGHGLIMFLFALWLVVNERKLAGYKEGGEMFDTVFEGRYIIMLMGLFAVYTGLIYNDCFSKSFNIFGTAWDLSVNWGPINKKALDSYAENQDVMVEPQQTYRGIPYYFGIDPIWQLATNKLTFTNSFKMKLSIVFGVTHMMFGVCLSFFNHRHFNKPLNIFTEFIPQVLFLFCIFGYLVILIFYKWIAISVTSKGYPSLLLALINMFLKFGGPIHGSELLFPGQDVIQPILVIIAVLCVPWMLLVKPFYLRHQHKVAEAQGFQRLRSSSPASSTVQIQGTEGDSEIVHHGGQGQNEPHDDVHEEFDFGEVFVHQAIHTIEYCLGCISNTASYLRLWALSLAHAELSEVLWSMVLHLALSFKGGLGVVASFALFSFWAVLTVAILLIMEGLSAFLHALRLHWVEFQSKFYQGTGYKFQPFSFKLIISGQLEE